MSTSTIASHPGSSPMQLLGAHSRVASVDIFRGVVMAIMIFVNDLADVKGLPAWTYHMPARVDAMSYVDIVFPGFLFVMGASLPFALQSRLARSPSILSVWRHVLLRASSLMVLGLILANADQAGATILLPLTVHQWALLALLGAAIFLAVYSKSASHRTVVLARSSGFLLVVIMLAAFRRNAADGAVHWLNFSYLEILGIIGWTYLATCLLYVPLRRWPSAPFGLLLAAIAFHLASSAHLISFPNTLPLYLWPWSNGAFVEVTLAGVLTAHLLLGHNKKAQESRASRLALLLGVALLAAGLLASPLEISKIRATPTWSLVSAGIAVFIFVLLHWICDERHKTQWASVVHAAGVNTLLTYLLPDFFFFAVGMAWLPAVFHQGLPGVLRSAVFTAFMLTLGAVLTRCGLRLRL